MLSFFVSCVWLSHCTFSRLTEQLNKNYANKEKNEDQNKEEEENIGVFNEAFTSRL